MRSTYRTKGKALVGDVNADGAGDRVMLRLDAKRPARCRHLVVVQLEGGRTVAATVPPLGWPGGNPQLLLLAEIDGRPGLEPVITLSPANVYRPGMVFTLSRGELLRMRLEQATAPEHFPLYDEFPAGVDCAGRPGTIVVTRSADRRGRRPVLGRHPLLLPVRGKSSLRLRSSRAVPGRCRRRGCCALARSARRSVPPLPEACGLTRRADYRYFPSEVELPGLTHTGQP